MPSLNNLTDSDRRSGILEHLRWLCVAASTLALIGVAGCNKIPGPRESARTAGESVDQALTEATRSYLKMGDIRSRPQLISGWYSIEDGGWRWMARQARAVLRVPPKVPLAFEMQLFFPPDYTQRAGGPVSVSVLIDGKPFAQETYSQPGGYRLAKPVPDHFLRLPASRIEIALSRSIPATGTDRRELGAVVQELGFVEALR